MRVLKLLRNLKRNEPSLIRPSFIDMAATTCAITTHVHVRLVSPRAAEWNTRAAECNTSWPQRQRTLVY